MSLSLGVVIALRGRIQTAQESLMRMVAAIDEVEKDRSVSVVIVEDVGGDPAVSQLLSAVSGANILRLSDRSGVGSCYAQAVEALSTDLIWLCTDDMSVRLDTLRTLAQVLEANPALPIALPGIRRPGAMMTRRQILCDPRYNWPDDLTTYAGFVVTATLGIEGLFGPAAVVEQCPVDATPGEPYLRTLQPSECRRPFRTVHPDAVQVGIASSIGEGGVFQTYMPSDRIVIGHYCATADDVKLVHPGPALGEALQAYDSSQRIFKDAVNHSAALPSVASFPNAFPDSQQELIPMGYVGKPLTIGNDVWLAHSSSVIGRVTVGDGAIVSAGSVVLNDVPPYAVVAGNPAKVVKWRFSKDTIDAMQRISWWNWSLDKVINEANALAGPIDDFVKRFDPLAQS